MRGTVAGWALACLTGLALAGCTSDNGEDDPGDAPTGESPLAEFLGVGPLRSQVGLPTLTEPERQRQDAVTELVAQCMTEQGFEYEPVPAQERMAGAFGDAYQLAPAEFAERYGYGVTTLDPADGDGFVDPNQQLRDALPADQQAAYDRALWGEDGCQPRASAEVYGQPAERDEGFGQFDGLVAEIGELYRRIETDPRLDQANQRWAGCMAAAGYPGLSHPDDARQSVHDRLAELPDRPAETEADVRAYELAIAPVDHACQQEHLAGPHREVTVELEQEFVDTHRDELERYRDWLAATGAP